MVATFVIEGAEPFGPEHTNRVASEVHKAVGRVVGTVGPARVECVTVDGITYETLPQSELDELRRAKRLRDEAIAALRGDANTHARLAKSAPMCRGMHEDKLAACEAALRYLGADGEG